MIFTSCHYDILDWMNIDDVYDTNLKKQLALASKKKDQNTNWRYLQYKRIAGAYLNTIII